MCVCVCVCVCLSVRVRASITQCQCTAPVRARTCLCVCVCARTRTCQSVTAVSTRRRVSRYTWGASNRGHGPTNKLTNTHRQNRPAAAPAGGRKAPRVRKPLRKRQKPTVSSLPSRHITCMSGPILRLQHWPQRRPPRTLTVGYCPVYTSNFSVRSLVYYTPPLPPPLTFGHSLNRCLAPHTFTPTLERAEYNLNGRTRVSWLP